jgi:hypothetical protein
MALQNLATSPCPVPNVTKSTKSGDASFTPRSHLVYIAMDAIHNITLAIHVEGALTATHICDAYFPDIQSNRVISTRNILSSPFRREELGRFEDLDIFHTICTTQPLPAAQQGNFFRKWVDDVLDTVRNHHRALWVENCGSLV